MKATVITDWLNVRAQPNTQSGVLGLLTMNQELDVLNVVDGWASLKLTAGGASLALDNQPATAYAFAQYLRIEGAPGGDSDGNSGGKDGPRYRLGLHTMSNTHLAKQEAERGCQFFLVMNDFGGAANLKRAHPNATVMVRRYIEHRGLISVDQMIHGLEGAEHKDLVYTGLNENDQVSDKGDGLVQRAQFDVAVARRVKEISGATYAAGTFSMGCPDFTSPEVCKVIRDIYAPAYNSGLIAFDMHLYSPNPHNIDKPSEWKWFERRWEFLFTRCGFDPRIRAIYCSECGLDEMGVGGFRAHSTSGEGFRDWCDKYIKVQEMPLVVDGVKYPSPIHGGAIFQLGGNGDPRWEGYNVEGYLPPLRAFYTGKTRGRIAPKRSVKESRTPAKAIKAPKAKTTKVKAGPAPKNKKANKPSTSRK